MSSKKESPKGTIVLFVSFLSLLIITFIIQSPDKREIPKDLIAVMRPHLNTLQPFTLTDHNEKTFTINNLKDKWSFIFFGYTHCPDICPTTLFTLKQVNNALKKHPQPASALQTIFISIDPGRDKAAGLAEYIKYFNKDFIAATGTIDNLSSFSKQFSAAYIKEASDSSGNYLMSHTSSIFLVNPDMQIVASFSPPHDADTITTQYLKIYNIF